MTPPQSTYEPLTKEQIEMLREGLLTSDWCGFSKRGSVNKLCDMAVNALLYAEEIRQRRDVEFRPTHRHAEGGQYQVLDFTLKVQVGGHWLRAVRYRNAEGMEFVRDEHTFNKRFTTL